MTIFLIRNWLCNINICPFVSNIVYFEKPYKVSHCLVVFIYKKFSKFYYLQNYCFLNSDFKPKTIELLYKRNN